MHVILVHGVSVERHPGWWKDFVPIRVPAPGIYLSPLGWERLSDARHQPDAPLSDIAANLAALSDPVITDAITTRLDRYLALNPLGHTIVIAHSMGTVLVLAALNRIRPTRPLDMLVTVGSPLWILHKPATPLRRLLRRRFSQVLGWEGVPVSRPAYVRWWVDVKGLLDPVALHGLGYFPGPDRVCLAACRHPMASYSRTVSYRSIWRRIVQRQLSGPSPPCLCLR